MNGKVKFYNEMKRFGFIAGEDGKEYFFHESGINPGEKVNKEDEITFEVEEGDRGPKAAKISKK